MEVGDFKQYGLVNTPSNIKTASVEFDMGLVKEVHPMDKPLLIAIQEYVAYEIAKSAEIGMYIFVGRGDPDFPNDIVYQINCSLPLTTVMSNEHTHALENDYGWNAIPMDSPITWEVNAEDRRVLLIVPVNSTQNKKLEPEKVTITKIHCRQPRRSLAVYESEPRAGSSKRGRTEPPTK